MLSNVPRWLFNIKEDSGYGMVEFFAAFTVFVRQCLKPALECRLVFGVGGRFVNVGVILALFADLVLLLVPSQGALPLVRFYSSHRPCIVLALVALKLSQVLL